MAQASDNENIVAQVIMGVYNLTPKVKEMLAARINVQNLVSDIQVWNREANVTGAEDEYGCYNLVRHRLPEMFKSIQK